MITGQKKVKSLYKYNGKERTEESEYHKLWKKHHMNLILDIKPVLSSCKDALRTGFHVSFRDPVTSDHMKNPDYSIQKYRKF